MHVLLFQEIHRLYVHGGVRLGDQGNVGGPQMHAFVREADPNGYIRYLYNNRHAKDGKKLVAARGQDGGGDHQGA